MIQSRPNFYSFILFQLVAHLLRTGEKLLAIGRHLGLSQTQMKHRINFKGWYGRISDYEIGKRYPTVLTLLAYARAAGIHIDDLVDDDTELKL